VIAAGCTLQGTCDSNSTPLDYCNPTKPNADQPCNAALKTPNDWYSNPIDAQWVKLPAFRQMYMWLNDANSGQTFVGTPDEIVPYVATNDVGSDAVVATGNLAVIMTCPMKAPCIMNVHRTAQPASDAGDAGAEASSDAASDAPND
jgi:hypothetical protein